MSAAYSGFTVEIPVTVRIEPEVTGAYRVEALTENGTPKAGEESAVTLLVRKSDGSLDANFAGKKKVNVSGYSAAPVGTSGSFAGTDLTEGSTEVVVTFTAGEAASQLVLHRAAPQTLTFSVDGVANPDVSLGVTPSHAAASQLNIAAQPSAMVADGKAFKVQPVIQIVDSYKNLAADSTVQVTAALAPSETGNASLTGTAVVNANGGIAQFTDLVLSGAGAVVQLSFTADGLTPAVNEPITVVGDFAGGSGTQADPYRIKSAGQLDKVRNYLSAYFVLEEDIDLGQYNAGSGWQPIGNLGKSVYRNV
ncbi:hypothetical protein [Brevibacillus massiliensis]|uniref:hypothetical protein n=1 Tax=Brevibacillus massiliensis TaxID=1118054 RepID=UPI000313421C|nr:hypothetical protein [Brevibacillus massiliensis]